MADDKDKDKTPPTQASAPPPATSVTASPAAPKKDEKDKDKPDFQFAATGPGGMFNIVGEGFGMAPGRVTINGFEATVTRWHNSSIKGIVPNDVKAGEVEVVVGDKKATGHV